MLVMFGYVIIVVVRTENSNDRSVKHVKSHVVSLPSMYNQCKQSDSTRYTRERVLSSGYQKLTNGTTFVS